MHFCENENLWSLLCLRDVEKVTHSLAHKHTKEYIEPKRIKDTSFQSTDYITLHENIQQWNVCVCVCAHLRTTTIL